MKAFRGSDGKVEFFEFDTDNIYFSDSNRFSNVTYNTDGSVAQIGGGSGGTLIAHDNFTKTVNGSTAVTCSSTDYTRYFNSFNNTARRLLESSPVEASSHKRFLDHDRSNSTYSYGYGGYSYSYYSYSGYSYYDYSNYGGYSYYDYSSYYDYNSYSNYNPGYECQCVDEGFNFLTWMSDFFSWLAELFTALAG